MSKECYMFNKLRRVSLYSLLVFGFCVAISNCLPDKTTLYAANKQVADTDDIAAAQRFEKVFEQVVEQVKPAVVSITSVKVFKHTQQKQRKMPMNSKLPWEIEGNLMERSLVPTLKQISP